MPVPAAATRPFDVVGLGENSLDLVAVVPAFPRPDTKQQVREVARLPGGQVATAMVACARLGLRARYVGRVGDDAFGRIGVASLAGEGVDVAGVEVVPGATSRFALVIVDAATSARTVLWDRDRRLEMDPVALPVDVLTSGRVLHVDATDVAASTAAARAARRAGARTTIDIDHAGAGVEALLAEIDVIIAAATVPAALTGYGDLGRALAAMEDAYPGRVIGVTLGEQGSLVRCGGREIRTPAFRVAVVDTTGAGDVFRAGFIAGWLGAGAGAALEDGLVYANAAAALACRQLGARAGAPHADEVAAYLAALAGS